MNLPADRIATAEDIQREAQAWLRRLTSGEATQWDAQAFRRWCLSSPGHQSAFDEAKRQWAVMQPVIGELLAAGTPTVPARRRLFEGRRAFLAGAAATAAATGVALVHPPFGLWPSAGEWQADYRTATGEQRQLALADRVSVTLNTQTSISRQNVDGETTGMELIAGEVAVDLNAARAFSVAAGTGRSIADAGRFEVRHTGGTVCVTCVEGTLRVEHPLGRRLLGAGQQATYDRRSLGDPVGVDAADLSAWRSGILVFKQTPLAQVVDEINRYRPGRVVLLARVRDSAVSGRFSIAALDAVLLQIQRSFDLDVRNLPGGVLVLS